MLIKNIQKLNKINLMYSIVMTVHLQFKKMMNITQLILQIKQKSPKIYKFS